MSVQLLDYSLYSDANLVAYYRMESEGLTTDSKGSFTLTNQNTVAAGAGKFGGAADLGNANTNKSLGIINNLGINKGPATIMGWIKLNAEIGSGHWMLFFHDNATSDTAFHVDYNYNGGSRQLEFTYERVGAGANAVNHTITLGTANWYHLAIVLDGSNVEGFVNGASVGSIGVDAGDGSAATDNGFYIGKRYYTSATDDRYTSALFDDVAVFTRALSDTEISDYYTKTTTGAAFLFNFV